jgi:putative flippase GtrA
LLFAHYGQGWGIPEMVITVINILINGVTEYLFMRLFVFKNEIDTRNEETKKPLSKMALVLVFSSIVILLLAVNAVVLVISDTTSVLLYVLFGLLAISIINLVIAEIVSEKKIQ